MTERKYLGKWELGCLVFHSCFYKIFTTYPKQIGEISGTAGWLTALFCGLVFLAGLWLVLWLLNKYRPWLILGKTIKGIGNKILAIYWLFSSLWAVGEFVGVLEEVAYPRSPEWFLAFFLLLGALTTVFAGGRAVWRMHSLMVPVIGVILFAIAVVGIQYAEPAYLAPWLGKGANRVFGKGLSTLFLYTDMLLIFPLLPQCRPEVKPIKTVMTGASLGVLWNFLLILVSSMSHSPELIYVSNNLIYPLTKAAYFGKFWSRLDAVYLVALMASGTLYLSMAIYLFKLALGKRKRKAPKQAAALFLCLVIGLSLTGCYDGREVEESAYAVALGIDKGEEGYRYTFQLSNPLELGGNIGKKEGEGEEETSPENKTVTNIIIDAEDFYPAVNQLKSHLSKEPDFSHLKLIVFSKEVAGEGILEHASLLFREQEIRPSTNLCLAESSGDFLSQVKPTLERSTARYYELLFQNQNTPYAPVVELREFVSRGTDKGWDPVLPVADKEKLMGMGIFQDGKLVAERSPREAMLYQCLTGKARAIAVNAGDSSFSVTARRRPGIVLEQKGMHMKAFLQLNLEAELIYGEETDAMILQNLLEEESKRFLQETLHSSCDILGIGKAVRKGCLTEKEWEDRNWREELSRLDVVTQIQIKT